MLDELNGQFAFAIWDNNRKELFLARDRMGIRPLFYTRAGNDWVFGSEIKAIFAHPGIQRKFDPVALGRYLHFLVSVVAEDGLRGNIRGASRTLPHDR